MHIRNLAILVALGLLGIAVVLGQDDACPALVEQALQAVGDNCAGMGRNTACYGYRQVDATFSGNVGADYFSHPSDRAGLTNLLTIQTQGLDIENQAWGVALMNVQANVPNTLPGQAVVFMLLGDVSMENRVAPDEAFTPADPVTVRVIVGSANIRSAPTLDASLVGTAAGDERLDADGTNADGTWYRVVYHDTVAWVNRAVIDAPDGLRDLPVIHSSNRTPMQAFYFSTGIGGSGCSTAPDSLVVQGPEGVRVTINANGADIHIGSTVALQSLDDSHIRLTVLHGDADINGLTIPAGFTVESALDSAGDVQPQSWTGFRTVTQEELDSFQPLSDAGASVLNYDIELPTMEEIHTMETALEAGNQPQAPGGPGVSTIKGVDCSAFSPASPLGAVTPGVVTFYWGPASGADQYQLTVYNESGAPAGTYSVDGGSTSVGNIDVAALGGGGFSWEVLALKGGQVACTTGRASVQYSGQGNPSPPPPPDTGASPTAPPPPTNTPGPTNTLGPTNTPAPTNTP